jgi:hypothetical protein
MIAKAFKPVAWVAAVAVPALGCYMLSLKVAAERAELANVETRILAARQDIRTLQTELGTRGRLQQLEQWNADVLALAAPVSRQFLARDVSLARFDTRAQEFAPAAQVQVAAALTPPAANPVEPALRQASLERPAPAAVEPVLPTVQRAALAQERPAAATRRPEPVVPAVRRTSLATAGRPAAAAARQSATRARPERARPLVSSDTAAALRRQARAERGTKRD